MDYVIVVNDNGELKTISATELERGWSEKQKTGMQGLINLILDARVQLEELDRLAREAIRNAS